MVLKDQRYENDQRGLVALCSLGRRCVILSAISNCTHENSHEARKTQHRVFNRLLSLDCKIVADVLQYGNMQKSARNMSQESADSVPRVLRRGGTDWKCKMLTRISVALKDEGHPHAPAMLWANRYSPAGCIDVGFK